MNGEIREGDVYLMRRRHPCGSLQWTVYRVGADIGIECGGCKRRVMLDRRKFEARAKGRIEGPGQADIPTVPSDLA